MTHQNETENIMKAPRSIVARFAAAAAVATSLIASGCTAASPSSPTGDLGAAPHGASSGAAPHLSVQPADRASTFCQELVQAGLLNTATLQDSSDPAKMLSGLDGLVSAAPDDIAADFAVFDQVEHATLDPTAPSNHADLTNPGTRDALQHFAAYLRNTCHLS